MTYFHIALNPTFTRASKRVNIDNEHGPLQRRNFKKWPFKPKIKKSLHTPSQRLRMYQTCRTNMCAICR